MIDRKLIGYGVGYLKNTFYSNLYTRFGINLCKPATISVLLTNRCNLRCTICNFWKMDNEDEMSTENWLATLKEIKKWNKSAYVQFSGGEPFVKKDVFELFEYCNNIHLSFGITTNLALILNDKFVEKLVRSQPFVINVSLDGIKQDTHDSIRGVKGTFVKVMDNIDKIRNEMSKQNKQLRIIIKTTVMKTNIDELEDIVKFVKEKRLTGINFQPIHTWAGTEAEELWITDVDRVREVSHALVDMKKQGFPILSSERDILSWEGYFKKESTDKHNRGKCVVGIKNFDIMPNGDVFLCRVINSKIGNLIESKPAEIWKSETAERERDRILNCKKLCLATCLTKRKMKDLVSAFLRMSRT